MTLIVPVCQPGWEEMENLRGNNSEWSQSGRKPHNKCHPGCHKTLIIWMSFVKIPSEMEEAPAVLSCAGMHLTGLGYIVGLMGLTGSMWRGWCARNEKTDRANMPTMYEHTILFWLELENIALDALWELLFLHCLNHNLTAYITICMNTLFYCKRLPHQ